MTGRQTLESPSCIGDQDAVGFSTGKVKGEDSVQMPRTWHVMGIVRGDMVFKEQKVDFVDEEEEEAPETISRGHGLQGAKGRNFPKEKETPQKAVKRVVRVQNI